MDNSRIISLRERLKSMFDGDDNLVTEALSYIDEGVGFRISDMKIEGLRDVKLLLGGQKEVGIYPFPDDAAMASAHGFKAELDNLKAACGNDEGIDIIDTVFLLETVGNTVNRRPFLDHYPNIKYFGYGLMDGGTKDYRAREESETGNQYKSKTPEEILSQGRMIVRISEQINRSLSDGRNVYIHCNAGQTRSPAAVRAYLMMYHKMKYEDAFFYVFDKRKLVNADSDLLEENLLKLEGELKASSA